MDRTLLKQSLDEWHEWYLRALHSLTDRDALPIARPTQDLALALTGIRRCGKTHLAFQLSKNTPPDAVLYYNFEDPLFYSHNHVKHLDVLLSVAQEYRETRIELLILDEIHVVEGWERWLRKLIDQKRFRIIVTGSSAKLLSAELATSLTGRAIEYAVWPFSFSEYLSFKKLEPGTRDELRFHFREFLFWGGFPEVAKMEALQKKVLLQQYLGDILLKDVISRHEIRNKRALDQVVLYYLTNPSSLHSYSALAKAFGFDAVTAGQYTSMLQDAFFVFEVHRYHHNLKVQSRDAKKVYIGDAGLRVIGARSASPDYGKLLENAVFLELRRRKKDIYYFYEKAEVDFLTVEAYKPLELIQVCASDLSEGKTYIRETEALQEAMRATGLHEAVIITFDREEKIACPEGEIEMIPAVRWFLSAAGKEFTKNE